VDITSDVQHKETKYEEVTKDPTHSLSNMWIHMGDLDVFTLDMGILSSSFK